MVRVLNFNLGRLRLFLLVVASASIHKKLVRKGLFCHANQSILFLIEITEEIIRFIQRRYPYFYTKKNQEKFFYLKMLLKIASFHFFNDY